MSVYKRKDKYWIDFQVNKVRYRKVSPDNSYNGAKIYESILRQKIARGEDIENKPEPKKKPITFADFAQKWFEIYVKNNNKLSEIKGKESIFRAHLLPLWSKKSLEDIASIDIEEYKQKKVKIDLSPKTINNHLTVLGTCLRTAKDWKYIKEVPKIKKLKVPPSESDYLTVEESKELLQHADSIWYRMIFTVLKTGMRLGELRGLRWEDINWEKGILTVTRSIYKKDYICPPKSNKTRKIPISESLKDVLWPYRSKTGYVFLFREGTNIRNDVCRNNLHRICNKAGLRRIGWHRLRHSFASHLAEQNISPLYIKELLGHSDIRTTMRYTHLSFSALTESINVIDSRICHNSVTLLESDSQNVQKLSEIKIDLLAKIKQKIEY